MRRSLAVLISGAMLLAFGCSNRYDIRLNKTLEEMKYTKRLNDNLQDAPKDGLLKELNIYVRAPKPLVEAKEFGLGAASAGLFDVEKTFFQGEKTFLHVVARVKLPKKPAAKGAAPEAAPPARAPFNEDLLGLLRGVYGEEEGLAKFKDDPHRTNPFKRSIVTANGKTVEVYTYKLDIYDVALIFQYDPADKGAMASKIALCLESFATGRRPAISTRAPRARRNPRKRVAVAAASRSDGPIRRVRRADPTQYGPSATHAPSGVVASACDSEASQAARASRCSPSWISSSRTTMRSRGASMPRRTWLRSTFTTVTRMSSPITMPSSNLRLSTSMHFLPEMSLGMRRRGFPNPSIANRAFPAT